MKQVWCLYRVSTSGQVDHDDIPMQRIACHEFVQRQNDWTITNELLEKGVSGYKVSSNDRDAIIEIKAAAMAKKFDVLLVFMFDRIGRREDETPFVVQWLVENGIEVWSTKEGEQRFDNHVDKLLNYIRYWQAAGESEKTSMRIRSRMEQLVGEGCYRGGMVAYGFDAVNLGRVNKKDQAVKDLVINEAEAAVVQIMFHKLIEDGWGTHRIARWLNERGIQTKRESTFWRDTSIRVVLRNPIVTGRMRIGEKVYGPFEHLRIVSDEMFKMADQILLGRNTLRPDVKNIGPLHTDSGGLLTGLIYCADCGHRMAINHCNKVKTSGSGSIKYSWDVYRCYRKMNNSSQCHGQATYRKERIEAVVMQVVTAFFSNIKRKPNEDLLNASILREKALHNNALRDAEQCVEKAKKEYTALQDEVMKALIGESRFDMDMLQDMVSQRKGKMEAAIANLERITETISAEEALVVDAQRQLDQVLEWGGIFAQAGLESQRMILANIIERVTVGRGYQIHIEFKLTMRQFCGDTLVSITDGEPATFAVV